MRFLLLLALTAGSLAYGADDSRLRACAKVPADTERLACYDKLAAEVSSRQTTPSPAAPVGPPREFGLPPAPRPVPEEVVKSVTANVTATHRTASGGVTVDLDNGQRWQQVGSADMGLEVGDTVTISRAMLGSFWLAPPNGRGSKVRRLQ